jgi:hypothetical protein
MRTENAKMMMENIPGEVVKEVLTVESRRDSKFTLHSIVNVHH